MIKYAAFAAALGAGCNTISRYAAPENRRVAQELQRQGATIDQSLRCYHSDDSFELFAMRNSSFLDSTEQAILEAIGPDWEITGGFATWIPATSPDHYIGQVILYVRDEATEQKVAFMAQGIPYWEATVDDQTCIVSQKPEITRYYGPEIGPRIKVTPFQINKPQIRNN